MGRGSESRRQAAPGATNAARSVMIVVTGVVVGVRRVVLGL